ncbi:MAG: hypothetical protein R3F53_09900 [Gammaproteobacteria bacterium]
MSREVCQSLVSTLSLTTMKVNADLRQDGISRTRCNARLLLASLLMSVAPLSHASGSFYIPTWFIALVLGVLLLLAMPLLWSLGLLAKRLISGVLSAKQRTWLRVGAGFHFAYAACYGLIWLSEARHVFQFANADFFLIIVAPVLFLIGLGCLSAQFGTEDSCLAEPLAKPSV